MESFSTSTEIIKKLPPIRNFPTTLAELKVLKRIYERFKVNSLKNEPIGTTLLLPMKLSLDTVYHRDYTITKELGRGLYGRAFEAYAEDFETKFVLKIMHAGVQNVDSILNREAEVLDAFDRLIDIDTTNHIIIQKKIDGMSLSDYLQTPKGQQEWNHGQSELALRYYNLPTIFYLESDKKFIHGDIRPANVIIESNGELKLIDFGMAQNAYPPGTRELEQQLLRDVGKSIQEINLDLSVFKLRESTKLGEIEKIDRDWNVVIEALVNSGRPELALIEHDKHELWKKRFKIE
jgi:serine/threonine protein kinase